jgi:hypothetical protein
MKKLFFTIAILFSIALTAQVLPDIDIGDTEFVQLVDQPALAVLSNQIVTDFDILIPDQSITYVVNQEANICNQNFDTSDPVTDAIERPLVNSKNNFKAISEKLPETFYKKGIGLIKPETFCETTSGPHHYLVILNDNGCYDTAAYTENVPNSYSEDDECMTLLEATQTCNGWNVITDL